MTSGGKKMHWAYSVELFNHLGWKGYVQSVLSCFRCKSREGQLDENNLEKQNTQ